MQSAVLVVDDEPGIRDTLRGVLRDEDFAVDTVASGEACLVAVETVVLVYRLLRRYELAMM